MLWLVELADEFDEELDALPPEVQDALLANAKLLTLFGPQLGRPHVDTLAGSRHANIAFAPRRNAVLLIAGDRSGVGERRFYRRLIGTADRRYAAHLERLADRKDS